MKTMYMQAETIEAYSDKTRKNEVVKGVYVITLNGKTYEHKEYIKSKGFLWDGHCREWYKKFEFTNKEEMFEEIKRTYEQFREYTKIYLTMDEFNELVEKISETENIEETTADADVKETVKEIKADEVVDVNKIATGDAENYFNSNGKIYGVHQLANKQVVVIFNDYDTADRWSKVMPQINGCEKMSLCTMEEAKKVSNKGVVCERWMVSPCFPHVITSDYFNNDKILL